MNVDEEEKNNTKKTKTITKKARAVKVFKIIKSKTHLDPNQAKSKSFKRSNEIRKRIKDVNDAEIVMKASKYSELSSFRKIYYTDEDYDNEQAMINSGQFGSKLEIAQGLLLIRIKEFKENLANFSFDEELKELNKENFKNDKDQLNEQEFNDALGLFREDLDEEQKIDENLIVQTNKVKKYLEDHENVKKDKNKNDSNNKVDKDQNIFRMNLDKEEQLTNSIGENIVKLRHNNEPVVNGKNFEEVYSKIQLNYDYKLPDSGFQFKNFMENIKSNNDRTPDKVLMEIIPVIAALVKENMYLKDVVNNFFVLEKTKKANEVIAAKKDKGSEKFKNKEIITNDKMQQLKNQRKYIEPSEWRKKPLYEKIVERFHFNDFRQNPYLTVWNKFSSEEKCSFIKMKLNWRMERSNELLKLDLEKDLGNIRMLNNFSYYEWRDPDGNLIPTYDIDDLSFYNKEDAENKKLIKDYLEKASNKNKVKSFIIQEGNLKLTKGKAWFNMPNLSLLGKKTRPARGKNNNIKNSKN